MNNRNSRSKANTTKLNSIKVKHANVLKNTELKNNIVAYDRLCKDDYVIRYLFSDRLSVRHKANVLKVLPTIGYLIVDLLLVVTAIILGYNLWQSL